MNQPETNVVFSANESTILGLRVGRCVSAGFDGQLLREQVLAGAYDICRLSMPAADEDAVVKLDQTGLPYHFSGSITRYKTRIADLPDRGFIHPDIVYEAYDGSQDDLLLRLLIGTWGTYPIGYYRTPYLGELITKEQEIRCVFEFYRQHNNPANHPNNTIMFMRHGDNYVGFFALNVIGDRLESHIGGIVEPFRTGGFFYDMQEYIRRFCVARQLEHFCFGARNENRRVQSIFQQFGYVAVDADNVFHIGALLTCSAIPPVQSVITLGASDRFSTLLGVCREAWATAYGTAPDPVRFTLSPRALPAPGEYSAVCSFPLPPEKSGLSVLKLYDANGVLSAAAHYYTR